MPTLSRSALVLVVIGILLFVRPVWLRRWQTKQGIQLPVPKIEWVAPELGDQSSTP